MIAGGWREARGMRLSFETAKVMPLSRFRIETSVVKAPSQGASVERGIRVAGRMLLDHGKRPQQGDALNEAS
jgi:hypothetical protein